MSAIRELVGRYRLAAVGAIVLVGALAVVLGLGLAGLFTGRQVADSGASPTASTTAAPSVSAEPTPAPSASASASASPTPPVLTGGEPFAAVVLVNDLNVRDAPGIGTVVGAFDAGDLVFIDGAPQSIEGTDWYRVSGRDELGGWISAGPEDAPYLELVRRVAGRQPAAVHGLAGDVSGILVWGFSARATHETPTWVTAVSADGAAWELGSLPEPAPVASTLAIDRGPAEWLMVASNEDNTATAGVWRSDDGLTWQALNVSLADGIVPVKVVGSESGYGLVARDDRSGTSRGVIFTSSDGTEWQQLETTWEAYEPGLLAMGRGYLAWAERPGVGASFLYSPDGLSWLDPSPGQSTPTVGPLMIDRVPGGLVATGYEPLGVLQVWSATLSGTSLSWTRQEGAEAQLEDTAISRLAATAEGLVVFGQNFDDGRAQLWRTTDGASWQELDPGALAAGGGIGPVSAGGPGLVAVGYEQTDAGPNPRLWRSEDGTAWEVETDPVLGTLDSPVLGSCPDRPTSLLEWLAIPGPVGATCFGDESVTFRAWLTVGGGCGGLALGIFEPLWLAGPFAAGQIILTPFEAPFGACGSAARHPHLAELPQPQQWVEITGHWADPASETCRYLPQREYPTPFSWPGIEFICRSVFVATEMTPSP